MVELIQKASPFSEMQTRLLEQEQRMRDLIDPPTLRAMREQEQRMRDLVDPPALRAMREQEQWMRDLIDPPALRAIREQERRMRGNRQTRSRGFS